MKACFLGFDLGSSSLKGVSVSEEGRLLATAKRVCVLSRPEPGRVEFDAAAQFADIVAMIKELAAGREVEALCFAGASGNTLLCDAQGTPLANAISWMDTRATGPTLAKLLESPVRQTVGWPPIPMFPLAHLAWFKDNRPELLAQAAQVGMNTDHILFQLTGRRGMDHSTATTFYLQDQERRQWHQPFLDILGINAARLPALMPSGAVLGTLTPEAAALTGLDRSTKVVSGCFDHPAAARGCGVFAEGDLLLSCGTSWVGFYPTPKRETALELEMLVDPFLSPGGPWGAMFSVSMIGGKVDQYIDQHICPGPEPMEAKYRRFDALAASAPPYGLVIDLRDVPASHGAAPAVLARAVMESAARLVDVKIKALAAVGLQPRRVVMVGGPSNSATWTRIVASVTGLRVELLDCRQHAGALGAALLGAVGAGRFRDAREAFAAFAHRSETVLP